VKLKLPEMKTGLAISALAHAALLLWGLISFAAKPLEAKPNDALPVDIISDKQFSEMTKGVKNAPKDAKPAPLVEKIGTSKPVDDSTAKVTPKKELDATKAEVQPPPPTPEPKTKPVEAKPETKPEPKVDPIAETLKKEEAKKKAEERAAKAKAEKLEREKKQAQAYDPTKIAALLDKRDARREAAAGDTLSNPGLGKSQGNASVLSQSEIDALRRRLAECWNPPVGASNAPNLKVVMRVLFKQDGSVANQPVLVAGTASPFGPAMAESAKRAILGCQPFKMLRPENYELWKDIEITFDPKDMFGG
jgi:outer membrane biosynthesis protein TonB